MNLSWSLISSSSGETNRWIEKIRQLKQIQSIHHGLMLVGPSGSGKSCAWRVLLETMYRCDGILSKSYVIDAKAISSKDILYGVMDSTTREWTDGVFTALLRRVIGLIFFSGVQAIRVLCNDHLLYPFAGRIFFFFLPPAINSVICVQEVISVISPFFPVSLSLFMFRK